MTRLTCTAALVALGLLGTAGRGSAQRAQRAQRPEIAPIRVGQDVADTLSPSDPRLRSGGPFHVLRLAADSGRRYAIAFHSPRYITHVMVARAVGPLTEEVTTLRADQGDSDVVQPWRALKSGPYLLVLTAADVPESVPYHLRVTELADPPLVTRSIAIGDSVVATFGDQSALSPEDLPYDVYTFAATGPQLLFAEMVSEGRRRQLAVAQVAIGRLVGGRFEPLPGLGRVTRTRVRGQLPESGTYAVRVMARSPSDTGESSRYLLRLDPPDAGESRAAARDAALAAAAAHAVRAAQPNVALRQLLSSADHHEEGGAPYQDWTYAARAGERFTVNVASREFDPIVSIGHGVGAQFRASASDDDGGGDRNARLPYTASAPDTLVIRVRSADTVGVYALRITSPALMADRRRPRPIGAGVAVKGELEDGDRMAEDGSPYQEWVYTAAPNERFLVEMTSRTAVDSSRAPPDTVAAFDTYLSVGRVEHGEFVEYANGDDAPGLDNGGNVRVARVVLVARRDGGPYVIRADAFGPFEAGTRGRYTLRVERLPRAAEQRGAR
jgi:hypothetical protein